MSRPDIGIGRVELPMRELHAWHGDRHRHARDAAADVHAKHAVDSPQLRVLRDPEVRKAEFFKYQKTVQEYEAKHAAGQLKPQEAKPEHALPETRDKPASRIASRDLPEHKEAAWKRKQERSWLPSNETSQIAVSLDALFTAVNASYHIVPGKVDGIAAAVVGVVVAGVAWANKRWKDKHHGDRPEG
jgi:hypothetical protein